MAKRGPSSINALIGIDKPVGITSHDVVARVRRALGERRVGHAGTLDPLASGVMVVGIGQATRLLGLLTLDRKSYIARISWGSETSTDDAEGEPVRTAHVPERLADPDFARSVLARMAGPQMQVPPAYSAISVDGVRSYRRARSGEDVELPARAIEVFDAVLLGIDTVGGALVWDVAFSVSKGTYIRALARDLGRSQSSAAHLSGLRRTASGAVSLADCLPIDALGPEIVCSRSLDPLSCLGVSAVVIGSAELDDVLCGRRISLDALRARADSASTESVFVRDGVALVHEGELRALARVEGGSLVMKMVFPQGIGGARP